MNFGRTLVLAASLYPSANLLAEPLTDFQRVVTACKAAYAERPTTEVAHVASINQWVKRNYATPRFSFDVQKTNSLVSPFVAYLHIADAVAILRAGDEAAAADLNPQLGGREADSTTTALEYAYQNQVWVFQEGTRTTKFGIPGSTPIKIAINPKRLSGPISRCIAG